MPRSPASSTWKSFGTVAKGVASRVLLDWIMRILPVSFSVKKIRPSGAKESETGKLTPDRKVLTGDDAWAWRNIQGPRERVMMQTVFTYNVRNRTGGSD